MNMVRRSRKSALIIFPAIAALLLGACSTQPGKIFELFNQDNGNAATTGSRVRLINNTQPGYSSRPSLVQPTRIICAEPSPDVAATVANTFGAGVSILGQGSGSISASQAEGLIQLAERTVTVQLLRDQMYRACEAYANGAITGTTYSLITSKNNKTMVTLMLGETAGGAVGRSLGGVGAKASSTARAAMQGLRNNSAAAVKADKDAQKAQADLDAANARPDTDTTKDQKVKDAQAKLDAADAARRSSTQATSASSAQIDKLITGGGVTVPATPELAAQLKQMQGQFLGSDFLEDYVSACVVELGLNNRQHASADATRLNFKFAKKRFEDAIEKLASDPKKGVRQVEYQEAREDFKTALHMSNDSYLSRGCGALLPGLMKARQGNLHTQAMKKLNIETVTAVASTLAQCQLIKDEQQQEKCQDFVIEMASKEATPAAVEITPDTDVTADEMTPPAGTGSPPSPDAAPTQPVTTP